MKSIIIYFVNLFILTNSLLGQHGDIEQLKNNYDQHFELNREAIYIHVNKDKFIYGEHIYFTAYLFNQHTTAPLQQDTNLYVGLYNSKGKQLEKSMWQVKNGLAYGDISIKPEYRHGSYYLKASTNWMRNFKGQIGSIKKIDILEYEFEDTSFNKKKYSIRLVPEGGQLVSNISNTIGFQVIDQNGLGLPLKEGEIIDSMGNTIIQNIKSNPYGIGKFNLNLKENYEYSCRFELKNGQIVEKKLPETNKKIFALNITGSIEHIRMISVRTNSSNLEKLNKRKFYIAIHRDGELKLFTFKFDKDHKTFSVNNHMLLGGVNIVSLLDQDFNLLAERVIFNHMSVKKLRLQTNIISPVKSSDSLQLVINIKQPINEQIALSVSIVPEQSVGNDGHKSIVGEILIKPYLDDFAQLTPYYFKNFDRKTVLELDALFLIHGRSNFSWEIFDDQTLKEYSFHHGISLKGVVKNNKIDKIKSVAMFQDQIDLLKTTEIKKEATFTIQNATIIKGEPLNFTLLGQKGKMVKPDVEVIFSPKMITDSIDISKLNMALAPLANDNEMITDAKQLSIEKTIALDNVTVIAASKENEPTKNPKLTTGFWNSEKITEEDVVKTKNISNYLRRIGFKVKNNPDGSLMVLPKLTAPMMQPPVIYLNGFRLREELLDFPLNSVDEVYYEHAGLMESNGGTIYIYRKNGSIVGQKPKEYFSKIIAKEGFQRPTEYRMMINPEKLNDTFKKYGSLNWQPNLSNDVNNQFYITIPNVGLNKFKIFIEGASEKGSFISEMETIELTKN